VKKGDIMFSFQFSYDNVLYPSMQRAGSSHKEGRLQNIFSCGQSDSACVHGVLRISGVQETISQIVAPWQM
jgi:hypothetical protein